MTHMMQALVYDGPYQMPLREVPAPVPQPDEVLIQVAYSGICGSELSGYEGQNSLRKPPLIMGHEFSGSIVQVGDEAARQFPQFSVGARVTANPLISCGQCMYCLAGQHNLCPKRKLHSASLPGSNAQWVVVTARALHLLPDDMPLTIAALTEPAACAIHTAEIARPLPHEVGLVIGAGPIGLMTIQALMDYGLREVYCADLNPTRLAMALEVGAKPLPNGEIIPNQADLVVDAVGSDKVRQLCVTAARPAGRVIWVGLHEAQATLPINDMIRREITAYGSFAYNQRDFAIALKALAAGRFWLKDEWTRVEPLERGAACFEELLHGSTVSKIWLKPS